MPSPIGHAIAGCAVVWGADLIDRRRSSYGLAATSAVVATLPDLDLLVPHFHRSATHSVTAVLLVLIIAAAMTGEVTHLRAARYGGQARVRAARYGGQARWRVALVCAAAYATHLLLDWLSADYFAPAGIQLFWPVSHRWFISGWDLFNQTERRQLFAPATIETNARAIAREVALLAPIALGLWLIRVKTLARFPSELARRDHSTQ
jgi:membrane-bound metal-dependent hydrolase YbcI (DUF457 family)